MTSGSGQVPLKAIIGRAERPNSIVSNKAKGIDIERVFTVCYESIEQQRIRYGDFQII